MRYGGDGSGSYGGSGGSFASPTFTGVSKFADGTKAAPAIQFADSPSATGWYRRTNNVWTFSSAGADAFEFADFFRMPSNRGIVWNPGVNAFTASDDTGVYRAAANSLLFGTGTTATTTSRTEINKAVTAFTDAAAKTVFTVTVPNAQHHAVLEVEVQGALGAGGAIGAGEAVATNTYKIAIVRTAGVATVATATAATHAVAVAVAGAATVTATAAVSAMTGAVSATQTFTIDVTITKSGGASDNHTCLAYAKLMNANATGITIA